LLGGGGLYGVNVARGTKPGDSLYLAKILSEKAQFAITFNEKDKAKLNMEFAGNRAEEMDQVLSEPNSDNKDAKVEQLLNDFNNEISQAKTRLEKIAPAVAANNKSEQAGDNPTAETPNEDSSVFSANLGKDNAGLDLSDEVKKEEPQPVAEPALPSAPTSTPAKTEQSASSTETLKPADTKTILDQAKDSLNKEDYNDTLNKLDEATNVITQVSDKGQVKGEAENATTTAPVPEK
jgi:hypothetical protein